MDINILAAAYANTPTIYSVIKDNIIVVILAIGTIMELTPQIKFNPISLVMDIVMKSVKDDIRDMKDDIDENMDNINKRIDQVEQIMDQIKDQQDRTKFTTWRWEILSFASAINNGQLFTEQEYQHIFEIMEEYNELHEKHGFVNGNTDDAIDKITKHHDKYKNGNVKYF